MTNKGFCGRPALFAVAWVALSALVVACGSDSNGNNNGDGGTGGEGTGGKASGGSAGKGSGGASATGGTKATGGTQGASGGTTAGGAGGKGGGGQGGSGGAEKPDASVDGGGDGGDGCVPSESFTVPTVPDAIKLPVPDETLLHHFHARGTQNYKCTFNASGTPMYTWVATPAAFLYDSCNNKVIQHSAGPTWTWLADGSAIKGTKVAGSDVAGSIQQLLLSAVSTGNAGELSNVNYVQRLDTSGGVSPANADCTASNVDEVRDVAYEATYYFYVASPKDAGADADSGKK